MACALQYAETEANRGKGEMKQKLAPNLGNEVVSEVFKTIGDSAGVHRAAADAKARSTTQQSQRSEEPGSASSSSASAPKAKAMPKAYGPSKAPPAKPPSAKAAPKHAAGWEQSSSTPHWKKVKRDG